MSMEKMVFSDFAVGLSRWQFEETWRMERSVQSQRFRRTCQAREMLHRREPDRQMKLERHGENERENKLEML